MKYFVGILSCIFALMVSCTGDDDEESVTVVSGENPVLGVWNSYYPKTDSLVMTRVFTYDFYSYFSFADGKDQKDGLNKQSYTIYENQLILDKYTQTFEIEKDTLWITNSLQDQTTKYIKVKLYNPTTTE